MLNKKLLEWAGFKIEQVEVQGLLDVLVYSPDGSPCRFSDLSFTQSLDACFKWLMPNLEKQLGGKAFNQWLGDNALFILASKNPALALCLAIEKLIDGEK